MNEQYKKDEKIIKHIVSNNVMTTDHNKRMQIIMYYRNCKLKYLILKNNITRKNHKLAILYTSYMRCTAIVATARFPTPRILDKPGIQF